MDGATPNMEIIPTRDCPKLPSNRVVCRFQDISPVKKLTSLKPLTLVSTSRVLSLGQTERVENLPQECLQDGLDYTASIGFRKVGP